MEVKEALVDWMTENETTTMVEEGEDILDGLEAMLVEGTSGVTDEFLMDATEISVFCVVLDLGCFNGTPFMAGQHR